jgi:hypothetical protein
MCRAPLRSWREWEGALYWPLPNAEVAGTSGRYGVDDDPHEGSPRPSDEETPFFAVE